MPNRATEFYDALRAACVAAIPVLGTNGVFEASQVETQSAEVRTLPYLVMETVDEPEETGEFEVMNRIQFRPTINLWLIRPEGGGGGGIDAERDSLYVLERYLLDNPIADGGQVLWPRAHIWNPGEEPISVVIGKLLPWVVGGLQIEAIYGETK